MSTYDDNEGSFDVHEKVDMLLKKSFGVVATKDSQLWFGENYGKSLTIFENDAINISSVPDEPLWEETPMDDVSLAEYNININTSNSFYDASFTGFNTIYYDNGVKKYTTGGEIFPGAYLDSTKTVILFVGLKLDRMETPSSTAAAEEDRALAFTKYPLDSSQNSILSNSFQFNYKKIGPGAIYNSDGGDSGETLWQPYTYQLRDSANTKIRFDEGNWFFDFKSGIITFSDSNDTAKDYPIYFTFVKYVGPRGLDKLISVDASFDSTDTVGYYENQIVVDSSNSEIYLLKYGSWNSIGGGGGSGGSGGSGGAFTIDGSDNAYYNTGNVGIGTSTPFSTLDVSGSANITGNLTIGSSPINVESKLGELDTSINLLETRVSELDTSVNALETITTDISYITGTTTILNDLDVSGNLTLPGIEISGNDIRGDGMLDLFASTNSSDSIGWIELRTGATRIGGDSIKFRPNNTTDSAGTDLITMTSSGYLGIGTTDPSNELHVIGSASITGNIGIGTSDPSHVFHIDKSATDVSSVTFHSHVGTGSVDYITNQIQLQTHGTTGATTVNNIGYISSFVDNSTTVHDSTYGLELGTRRSIGTSSQIIESTAKIEISPESVILKGSVFMKYGDDNTILSTTRDDGTIYLGYSGELEVGTGNLLEISGNVNIRENHDLYVSGSTSISGDLTIGATSINVESQLGLLDDSISLLEDDISGLDASVNALETITTDISYASGTTTVLNNLDVSGDVTVDGSLNIGMQTDVESKFGELDNSINLLETDISELDTSVNRLETITTDISYSSGTTTILNDLDVSGDVSMSSGLIVNGSGNFKGSADFEQNVTFGSNSSDVSLVLYGDFKIKGSGNLVIEDSSFSITEIHTNVKITDILDISNDGTGPALIVRQYDTSAQDIARFMDGDAKVFTIGNNGNTEISNDVTIGGDLIIGGTSIEVESKFGALDISINFLETDVSELDTSVNALETITTDISYAPGTTTILNNLDVSGNLSIDGSLNLGTIQDVESKFGELDNSINLLETNVAELDTSVNVLETITTDISYITGTTSILNNLDVSGDLSIDGSLNLGTIQDVESKLGELDNSINYLETTISAVDASVNALETITTDISYISGTTTVTGALDISSTDSLLIPRGTTSERNSETPGALRFNRDTSLCEVYTQSNIWSGLPVYKAEQPPHLHSPSTTKENKSFTISWSKFDEIYKDAYDGKSYPIFLQTYVDVSYSGTNGEWKTIYIGPGNCNSSGNAVTPSLDLSVPDSGFSFDDSDGTYSRNDIDFNEKPDVHSISSFDQNSKFDFRVYAVNNSGKTPNYLTIEQVGLETTNEPSPPEVTSTHTFTQNSFKIDTSFNVDKDNSGVTINEVTIDHYDVSYLLTDTKSFETRTHSNNSAISHSSKTGISLSGLYPGAVYDFQVQVKNTANTNESGYGQSFTSSKFTHASDNNQYIILNNLNDVDNDNMTFTKYNFSNNISLRINDGGSNRTMYTLGNSNSYIGITGESEFYVNYGLQGLDMSGESDLSLVEATVTIKEAGYPVSSQTLTYYGTHDPDNVSPSTIDISNGATTYSYQFSSGETYTDKASSSYNNGGFVYSSTFYISDDNDLSGIFNDNFKPSTNSYELLYNISSSSTQTNGASYIGKTNTTTGDKTTGTFYVDNYSMNPVIEFTTRPTLSTTATYLFGIPSVATMSIDYDISISDFANYFIPSNDSGVHSGINEIVKDSYTITAHTYNSTNSNDSYNIKASGRSVTVNNDTNTGYYDADTSDNLSVYVYYLDHNSGAPTRLTQNASSEIYDIGHIFINSERTYSDYSLYTFDGVNTITSIGDMTISSFATTSPMDTDISTTLLRFDGKFVSGGYSTTYNGVTITPFSDWSSGYAVDGPDYNNYLNTGLNNFKWIAIDVTSKKSGSNVNLGGFKINDSSPDISKFGNTSDESGYEAYIYHGGKFGALKGAHSTGDTSWFLNDTYYGSISNANSTNANGALQSSSDSGTVGVDAFIDESDSSNIYLIVGLPQNANSYFTFS